MEGLIELVAASFARHGVECPAADPEFADRRASSPAQVPILAASLPEHNFQKSLQDDPAP